MVDMFNMTECWLYDVKLSGDILLGRFALALWPETMHAWVRLPVAMLYCLASVTRRPGHAATCHVAFICLLFESF